MLKDIKNLVKDSLLYGLGNISVKLIGFILLPLYLSRLTPADYGVLGLVEVTTQVLLQLFGLELYQALMRWYWEPGYRERQKTMFFSVILFVSLVAALLVVSGWLAAESVSQLLFRTVQFTCLVRLMFLLAGLQIVTLIPSTLLRVQGRPGLYTVTHILNLLVSLGLTIYLVVGLGQKVEGIYLAQVIGYIFNLLILGGYIRRNIDWHFEWTLLKEMLHYSLPLVFSTLAGVLLVLADRYTLNYMGTLADVGIYSLGFKIANTIKVLIVSSVQLAIYPIAFRMVGRPNALRFYSKIMTYLTFGVMFFVLCISFYGQEIVKFFTHNRAYWDAYQVIPLISFGILFGMLKDTAVIGLSISKQTRIIAVVIITMSLLNLGLNILLIPHFKSVGAAFATLVTQILFFVVMLHFAQRRYYIPYELKKVALMIILGVLLTGGVILFRHLPLLLRLGLKLIMLLIYPLLLYCCHFYEKVELETLKNFWNKWCQPRHWRKNIADIKF